MRKGWAEWEALHEERLSRIGAFTWGKVEQNGRLYMRKGWAEWGALHEERVTFIDGGFWHSGMNFCNLMTHLVIGLYDDTSHELVDMMTHHTNWLIWWHIAWIGWCDISREFGDMLTYHKSMPMWWHMASIWWCTVHSRRVSQFPAYMYKMLNTGTNQVPPSIGPWWEPSIPPASPNILQPAVSVTCSQEPTSSRPPLFSQPH